MEELHQRVKELFAVACEKTEAERPGFLRDACGDDEALFREVESLLRFHETSPELDETAASAPRSLLGETIPASTPGLAAAGPPPRLVPLVDSGPRSGTAETRTTGRFEPGEIFAGRYRIIAMLGMGGMGEVYHAHDQILGVDVALKFISQSTPRLMEGMLNEVRLAREVTHPNVCRVFDISQVGQEYYFTMEYVDGEDLSSLLRQVGRFTADRLVKLAREICAGLAAAHARGVLHHDLKPANILVTRDGQAKITDFGIAGHSNDSPQLAGTPAYMPPERLAGRQATVESDLYALGLVLYELASGERVFQAATPREYAELHQRVAPDPLRARVPDLDPRIAAVIERCLQKDPRDRPASALEVEAALPGGDALRLAVEVGLTPSPDMVADARSPSRALSPPAVGMLLLWLVAGLVFVAMVADRTFRAAEARHIKPPEVLAERARETLIDLGYEDEPVDEAWGIDVPMIGAGGAAAYPFWYRSSADYALDPDDVYRVVADELRVDLYDPPLTPHREGMVHMLLDASGRLISFYVVPPFMEEDLPEQPEAIEPEKMKEGPDYSRALRRAGFDPAELRPAEPRRVPPFYANHRAAWVGRDPRLDPSATDAEAERAEVKIDAAALNGRVVYFSAWPEVDESLEESFLNRMVGASNLYHVGVLVLSLAAGLLAWRSLRNRRGDLRSAHAIAVIVILLKALIWLLVADHVPDLASAMLRLQAVLGVVLVEALVLWLAYIGLEPTARRFWPQILVAWNRLLRGRFSDPQVGRALLVGALAGTGWTVATQLDRVGAGALGLLSGPEIANLPQLTAALDGRMPFANLLFNGLYAIYGGILWLLLLAVLRLLFGRTGPAVAVFVLARGAFVVLDTGHPQLSWLLALVVAGSGAWLIVRFGLLAWIVALMVHGELLSSPITTDFSAWFSGSGLFALTVVLVLGAMGGWIAMGGRASVEDAFAEPTVRV